MSGRKVTGPGPVEAPRVAEALTPFDGEALEDGDILEAVLWTGPGAATPGSPGSIGELEVSASRLSGLRLTGLEMDDLLLLDTAVEGCELSGVVVSAIRCERVAFRDCRLSGAVLTDLRARHVRFAGCQLDGAWLRSASFEQCELVDCDLTGAQLHGARFTASRLVRCRLDDADLTDVFADELPLHGSSLVGTKGLDTLRHLVITTDQIVDLALPLLTAHAIRVDDHYLDALDD